MTQLQKVWIEGYRSLEKLRLQLGRITLIQGANGAGKTNFYRALRLIAEASHGQFLRRFAEEGGLESVGFASNVRREEHSQLSFTTEFSDFALRCVIGFAPSDPDDRSSMWDFDPQFKSELIWPTDATERSFLFRRDNTLVRSRDDEGHVHDIPDAVGPWEMALSELKDPRSFPAAALMRNRLVSWRFYHQFRTDEASPIRRPQPGFRSNILDSGGENLASTFQTILEVGDHEALHSAVDAAFPGGNASVSLGRDRLAELSVRMPSMKRSLSTREFSDGQLRFMCLACALLSPRAPELLVLNEPETSLSDTMVRELARLIDRASKETQIIVTTHSTVLVNELADVGAKSVEFEKVDGRTTVVGQTRLNWV